MRKLYLARVHKKDFDLSLDILSDMIQNSAFPEEELEKEKNVVKNELLMTLDSSRELARKNFPSVLYEEHPAKDPVIGTEESLKQIERQGLVNEWQANYTSESMAIAVVGGIEHKAAMKKIEKAFEDFDRAYEGKERSFANEKQEKKEVVWEKKGAKQSQLLMGYKVGHFRDKPNQWALPVINAILEERVFNSIREEEGLSYNPHVGCRSFSTFGYSYAGFSLEEKNFDKAKQLIEKEFRKLSDLNPEEIEKKKNSVIKSRLLHSEDTLCSAIEMLSFYLVSGNPSLCELYPTRIDQVNFEDVQETAEKYFKPNKYGLLHLKPK